MLRLVLTSDVRNAIVQLDTFYVTQKRLFTRRYTSKKTTFMNTLEHIVLWLCVCRLAPQESNWG